MQLGWFDHGIHGNASLCGTEMAEKKGFHAFQPHIAPFKRDYLIA